MIAAETALDSIVTRTFNSARYFGDLLRSVENQGHRGAPQPSLQAPRGTHFHTSTGVEAALAQ